MTTQTATTNAQLLRAFEGPWRDETPVFGCCRRAVAQALEQVDVTAIAAHDAVARVQALREGLEQAAPGHLATHRCCAGHVADLAFDLPDLLAPVTSD